VSRATVWELLGTTGAFNSGLRGEQVTEWQAGLRREAPGQHWQGSINLYRRATTGLITEVAAPNGVDRVFQNAGDAVQHGAEVEQRLVPRGDGALQMGAGLAAAVQWSRIRMDTASVDHIPGNEPWRIGLIGHARHRSGTGMEAGVRVSGAVFPTFADAGAITGGTVVHLRLMWQRVAGTARLEAFVHVENLINARYTSWVQVNDATGRHYNPAPGRSFFAGLRLTIGSPARRRAD
jgi:iron complex outermembrane receptor protein